MNTQFGVLWTPEEDSVIRSSYGRRRAADIARTLGRSFAATTKRARRLGLQTHKRWTKADIEFLNDYWGHKTLAQLSKEMGRTKAAIYQRANESGLDLGVPDGYEYLTDAAERTGFAPGQLRDILKAAGATLRITTSRPTRAKRHYHMVDTVDVDEAVEKWLACEETHPAAEARGICGDTLRRWLRDAIAAGFEVPPEPTLAKARWRVPSKTIDAVIAWRGKHESLSEAARRVGLGRCVLTRMLKAAGVPRRAVKPWLVPRTEVDRVVAEHGNGRKAA